MFSLFLVNNLCLLSKIQISIPNYITINNIGFISKNVIFDFFANTKLKKSHFSTLYIEGYWLNFVKVGFGFNREMFVTQ